MRNIIFSWDKDGFTKAELIAEQKIAHAATGAITEAADLAKQAGRQSIAAGGFSTAWQNSLRSKVYPTQGESLRPAANIWHNIPFADVFEYGKTINGNPMLWIRLPTTPKGLTPALAVGPFGKLVSLERPGKPPLLAAMVRENVGPFGSPALTKGAIRRGGNKRKGRLRAVPLFVGIPLVNEQKKFGILDAVKSVADDIGELYMKHFEE